MAVRTSALLLSTIVLVSCGGGGSGGETAPLAIAPSAAPTAVPRPEATATAATLIGASATVAPSPATTYVLPKPSATRGSSFVVDSAPHGLAVTLDAASLGHTPVTTVPAYSKALHAIAIVPMPSESGSPVPYVATFAQTGDGTHSIFYNAPVDTFGAISTNDHRDAWHASQAGRAFGVRRPEAAFSHRPLYDDARIVVHYDAARFDATRSIDAFERAHGATNGVTYSQSSREITRIVTLAAGAAATDVLRAFANASGVTSVDRVRLRYPLTASRGPVYPNDPLYVSGAQWYLDAVDVTDAWGYGLGNASVPIAVIDTGYDPLQTEVAPGVTFSERIVGGTIETARGSATDTDGHGTFVSGVASAHTGNGLGEAGVSYGASLQEYKVFSDGTAPVADSSDVAEAVRQAVAHGAKIIVAAIGGEGSAGPDALERDAVAYAIANGVTVVAGAGNEGNATLDYPAAYDGVIAVGASAVNDKATPGTFVGYGNFEYVPAYSNGTAGLVAPGGDPKDAGDDDGLHWIANAYITHPYAGDARCAVGTVPSSCDVLSSGTSASAAEVAGTAALMLSRNATLAPAKIEQILYGTADDIADPRQGHGRLDAHAALAVLEGDPAPVPALPAPSYQHFIAFAYSNSSATTPHVLDITYPHGVPVSPAGTFRIADTSVAADGTYKIAVWDDTNADGIVDAGDYFGAVPSTCAATGPCAGAGDISVHLVAAGFRLP